jgi:hypothetical protein
MTLSILVWTCPLEPSDLHRGLPLIANSLWTTVEKDMMREPEVHFENSGQVSG